MFGSNNNKKEATKSGSSIMPSSTSHSLNSLVKGTVVEGSVNSESDIRIDGTIKGKLFCKSKVIIGPTGYIEGEIHCQNAVIEGRFQGMLNVKGLLNIKEKASINGDVTTSKLVVQPGAVFNVTCTMGGSKPASNPIIQKPVVNNKNEVKQVVKEAKTAKANA